MKNNHRKIKLFGILSRIFLISVTIVFFGLCETCYAGGKNYPLKIEKIERSQANYLTPENTLAAMRSALLEENLEWADEMMTQESLKEEIKSFKNADIDRRELFELEKNHRKSFIIDKVPYKDVIIVVVKAYCYTGSIKQVPVTLIKENGQWKFTNKYAADEKLLEYLDYITPNEK